MSFKPWLPRLRIELTIFLLQAWDLLEGGHLFFAKKNRVLNDEQHLAEMVSLLGPPPPEFLVRSEMCRLYWDDQGMTSNPQLILREIITAITADSGYALLIGLFSCGRKMEGFDSDP